MATRKQVARALINNSRDAKEERARVEDARRGPVDNDPRDEAPIVPEDKYGQ